MTLQFAKARRGLRRSLKISGSIELAKHARFFTLDVKALLLTAYNKRFTLHKVQYGTGFI